MSTEKRKVPQAGFLDRLTWLTGDEGPYTWGREIGLTRGVIDGITRRGLYPSAESLQIIATAERVNLTWLLTGEGPPYQVNPPPDPQDLELGPDASYYLFDRPDGIQPPLVCMRRDLAPTTENAPLPKITVYNGHPSDLMRAVEWLIWKGKLIQIVEDNNGDVARLRAGLASNKILINAGRGLLEQPPIIMPIPRMVVTTLVEETHNGYLAGVQSTLDAQEREWIMLRRELTPAQREALLLILRGLTRGD